MSIKINGIRKIKNEDVYCLTVEDDESYIADNIISHNCPSFLYWALNSI